MAIPTTIESLSTTAASNGPAGSEQRSLADDGLRQAYAFIKQVVSQGSDIASASTITPSSTGHQFDVTGTTSITTIASTNSWDGRLIALQFDGVLTLTHSSNLYLPGAANITTAAGDVALFLQRGSGAWQCISYSRKADNLTVQGNLTVNGNTTLGNAGTDTVTTNGNVTVNAPTSGVTMTVNGLTNTRAISVATGTTSGYWPAFDASDNFQFGSATAHSVTLVTNASTRLGVSSIGKFTFSAASSGYTINLPTKTPASAADTGTTGDISWDSSFLYVCTGTNTWKRAAIATW